MPSNEVVERLARALGVEPEHFREYRLRVITERLETLPDLVDRLYRRAERLSRGRLRYRARHGAWRSLVSALVWGTRGPEFESRRPDYEEVAAKTDVLA